MLRLFAVSVLLTAPILAASAQPVALPQADVAVTAAKSRAAAPQPEISAGNLPPGFYAKPNCVRPPDVTLPKPALTDRDNILLYNNAIRHHNQELESFGACIDAFTGRASLDIDWILFTVNAAIAKANNASAASAPAALGNMPSGFYPAPDCIKPGPPPGAAPAVQDVNAMMTYNAQVKAYNVLAETFQACLKSYAARARGDVARIEQARVAASQAKAQ